MTRSTKIRIFRRGASMLFDPAALPLSRQTLTYTAGVTRRRWAQIGSCRRKLACGQQALLVLAHLRKGETFAELAAGFGIVLAVLAPEGDALMTDLFPRFNAEESFVVSRLSRRQQEDPAAALRSIHGLLDAAGEERRAAVWTSSQLTARKPRPSCG